MSSIKQLQVLLISCMKCGLISVVL